jgi:site-specific recombinase XerD
MTLDSVDFATGSVIVFRGKNAKPRALSVVDADDPRGGSLTLRLLAQWIDVRPTFRHATEHQLLWVNNRGQPLERAGLRRILARICEAAGVDGNRPPHAFRRANFSENYIQNPAMIEVLAARMGWSPSSRNMINTYTRGAEIDLARTSPVPSIAARWRSATPMPFQSTLQPRMRDYLDDESLGRRALIGRRRSRAPRPQG